MQLVLFQYPLLAALCILWVVCALFSRRKAMLSLVCIALGTAVILGALLCAVPAQEILLIVLLAILCAAVGRGAQP